MDEQQQAAANAQVDPTQPVVEQPVAPEASATPQETPQEPVTEQPAATSDQAVQDAQTATQDAGTPPVDPSQDFIDAYDALCQEKGKQFKFQLTYNVNDDGSFDLTSAQLQRLVVDLSSE